MKKLLLITFGTFVLLFTDTSCSRETEDDVNEDQTAAFFARKSSTSGTCNPNAYIITLESRTQVNGNWEWVWSVYNPNPGNGNNNGTSQDLSHWGMQLPACVDGASVIGAAYSRDGSNWGSFSPAYQPDPSQGCMSTPVLKFDFGTSGSAKSYYRLVVNKNYTEGIANGYYKSGNTTGCCIFTFTGIGGCGSTVEDHE